MNGPINEIVWILHNDLEKLYSTLKKSDLDVAALIFKNNSDEIVAHFKWQSKAHGAYELKRDEGLKEPSETELHVEVIGSFNMSRILEVK